MRVNVKPDGDQAEKLKQLQSLTRLSVSEIVKRAIDLLHRQQMRQAGENIADLLSSGFIGCAEGPADLSANYMRYLTQSLEDKHGIG